MSITQKLQRLIDDFKQEDTTLLAVYLPEEQYRQLYHRLNLVYPSKGSSPFLRFMGVDIALNGSQDVHIETENGIYHVGQL